MRRLLVIAILAGGCTNNDDVPPPHVANVLPDHAAGNAIVELDGMFFCQVPADTGDDGEAVVCDLGSVNFGEQPGTVSTWTDTQIMVELPSGPVGAISVTVTTNGRSSNGIELTRTD